LFLIASKSIFVSLLDAPFNPTPNTHRGIAGLIKSVLVLGNESAPPVAGLEVVNPLIQQTIGSNGIGSSIKLPNEVESIRLDPLNGEEKLLVAGVSSFGYSGTIAHAIVQQAPLEMCRDVIQPELETLNNTVDDNSHIVGKTMFLFTGQGSQYAGMGQTLYEENEVFRRAMDECETIYKSLTKGDSLLGIIFKSGSDNNLVTSSAGPALIALEYSLNQMWIANDVIPDIVLGHSDGEIAAACTAGAMSIETAMKMVVLRARMMNDLPSSDATMIAIRCDRETAEEAMSSFLDEGEKSLVGVACVNGPNNIVLSGVRCVVEKLLAKMNKNGVYLEVSHSFHSPLMKSIEDDFRSELKTLDICNPLTIPLASTVTGLVVEVGEVIEIEHWVHQLASTVLFEDAFAAASLVDNKYVSGEGHVDRIIIEVGPKPVLSRLARGWWRPRETDCRQLWVKSMDEGNEGNLRLEEDVKSIREFNGAISSAAPGSGLHLYDKNSLDAIYLTYW